MDVRKESRHDLQKGQTQDLNEDLENSVLEAEHLLRSTKTNLRHSVPIGAIICLLKIMCCREADLESSCCQHI